ncbi:hypothetical protein [Aquimarina litoralis]|uniref:hypothetical protein n=1 Tax=Aquimarina litoralis TaxID=584605 RepID=UPI001C56266A|nr:hypothetical protein [Aquimarina litoralis]MBW1296724.1 hypothetical protein [Aquimarina litoralis]
MKTIHNINKWSFIITLLLYVTIYLGLLAQIPLGFIQFVLAFSILAHWKKLNNLSKKLIVGYWSLFVLYWITFFILNQNLESMFGLFFFSIIPMSIASYFVYVTYRIKKYQEQIELKPSYCN